MDAAAAAQPVPWPDAPTQVTDLETAANVLSMQERAVRSILRDINDGGDEAHAYGCIPLLVYTSINSLPSIGPLFKMVVVGRKIFYSLVPPLAPSCRASFEL